MLDEIRVVVEREIRLIRRPQLVVVQVVPEEQGIRGGGCGEHVAVRVAEDVVVESPGRLDDRLAAHVVGDAQPRHDPVERLHVEKVNVLGREHRREIAGAGKLLLRQIRVLILPSHAEIEASVCRCTLQLSLKYHAKMSSLSCGKTGVLYALIRNGVPDTPLILSVIRT